MPTGSAVALEEGTLCTSAMEGVRKEWALAQKWLRRGHSLSLFALEVACMASTLGNEVASWATLIWVRPAQRGHSLRLEVACLE